MSKVNVTDLEYVPEGPPRDLMMYLQDNGEEIQRLDKDIFWTTIISYILAYYDASTGEPLSLAIEHLSELFIGSVEHAQKMLTEEVDDG